MDSGTDLATLYSEARARNPGVSVDDALTFFVRSLADPLNPLCCCPSVVASILVIQPDKDNINNLLKSSHALWSTAISFLTVERSLADIEALGRRWAQCTCTTTGLSVDTQLHLLVHLLASRGFTFGPGGGLSILLKSLVRMFVDAFHSVNVVRVAKGRSPKMWPVSPRDLIPYGPEVPVKSIVNLAKFMDSAYALTVLSFLLHICGSLIIPAVISSPLVAEYIVQRGLRICADVQLAHRAPSEPVSDAVAEQFWLDMTSIASLLDSLQQCLPDQNRQFHADHVARFFEFVSKAIEIIESSLLPLRYKLKLEPYSKGLALFAGILNKQLPDEMIVPREHLNPTVTRVMDICYQELCDPAIRVWGLVRHTRATHICYALECTESLQSSGSMYQRCGGCLVVGYSSKECQKRAWKDPRIPHRDICKKLRQVVDAGKGHVDPVEGEQDFVQAVRRANIADGVLCDISDWLVNVGYMLSTVDGTPAPGWKF